ncbi:MFS transporter [Bacillus aquiflavi]|uniref:MFS transporter n=1 Tax=Bacillus aquiflavi TaxID=2672567 RepID=A0A6B3W0M7_9BACI|nr:MFS transporter [Bacillus aquiflavi]MBA4538377.1 MFS transporter [Bacillus aquiflavi]NEY82742.1 MFS transporter [Bacillus aquiflavi]
MWRNRNVWIILFGEFIAGLGLWTGIIGNLEFMQDKIPSDFVKSLILSSGLLAGIIVGPLAGKIIDQTKKKTVMVYSGLGRMFSVVFMFIAIYTGSVWWMVLFMISMQISAAFYFPALQSAIPLIVKEKDLLQLNGVHMNVATLSRVIGTALAGAMLVVMSLFMLYISSFIAYFILFIFTLFLQIEETNKQKNISENQSKGDFKEVLPIIKGLPIIMMTLIMTLVPLLFIGGFNLMVINISEIHHDPSVKGLIYAAEGIAFMIGAFFIKQISHKWSPYGIMFFFSVIIGLAQLSLYFVDFKLLTIASFAVFGFAVGCFFPTAATIFQTKMPKKYHGRFFSFRNMLDRIIFQIVLLGTGFLLDLIGLKMMVIVFGIISLSLTTIFYIRYKRYSREQNQKKDVTAV